MVLQVPMVMIDTDYFGKLVVAPLNIVVYNVFGEHGPDLYGEFEGRQTDRNKLHLLLSMAKCSTCRS